MTKSLLYSPEYNLIMDIPIGKVETADEYLDIAFVKAKKRLGELRSKIKSKTRIQKSRELELERINVIKEVLVQQFEDVLNAFPQTDDLAPFYEELLKITVDFVAFKKSLGALRWAQMQIKKFFTVYNLKIKGVRHPDKVNEVRKQFSGRISSVVKQIKKELLYLEGCRKILKRFPKIKLVQTFLYQPIWEQFLSFLFFQA